ncbi:uncharacterized protein LOC123531430 [Mercenaria mercenaria]|uniref:uncharacterized protein LOC123531430 n=1 Tax=Mercenaria mercenaria TaxID=6596 RepID=UPI00234EEFE9|nr:uncharacterized protein LOC123531430 [Mercenaria mercenaria]
MAALKQVLQIEPAAELVFPVTFDENATTKLKLTNPSQESICFKIMVKVPAVYTFKPNKGIIPPNQSTEILVTLQSFKYDENQTYRHKIMVRSMFARGEQLEDRIDQMWKDISPDAVMGTKLDCRFIQAERKETLTSRMTTMKPDVTTEKHTRYKGQSRGSILVASIDIGNTYTRCAVSSKYDYHKDPTDITVLTHLCSTESTSNPTMVLKDDNKMFDSFGYDALDKYMEHRQGHLFKEIKLPLYRKLADKDINNVQIKDELGKQIPAVEVFQAIINRVKDHLHAELERLRTPMMPEEIYWVITVPAVFTDRAVTLIETAAIQSGIAKNNLNISTEPVSALEYCKHTHKRQHEYCTIYHPSGLTSSEADIFQDGRQYIVVDIGGETLDVTVIKTGLRRNVTEQHKVCVVGSGSNSLHEALDNVLTDLVGNKAYHRFSTEKHDDYRFLHKVFNETLKNEDTHSNRVISVKVLELIVFDIESEDNFKTALGMSPYAGEISVCADKLRLSAAFWKGLVAEYCLTLVKQLNDVFEKYSCDKNICLLLVGGSASFKTVQEAVMKEFNNFDIFIPMQPEIATVGGSVMLGHVPPFTIDRVPNGRDTIVMIEDNQSKASDCKIDDQAVASDFVQSISEMSVSSDFIEDETIARSSNMQTGLKSLSQRLQGKPQEISVRRNYITADVITAYGDIDASRPLKVCFADEDDKDMTREMFGLFWEKTCSVWFRGENATIPLVPVAKRAEARRVFPVLGKILEHMLCILGQFPTQICRSLVLAIAHPDKDVDADLVLDDYLLYAPERESILLSQSLAKSDWSESRKKRLTRFFSVNKISMHPTPKSFREDLLNIAYAEIIDSSHVYVALMRRGISDFALKHFFDVLDTDGLRSEYEMTKPTTERVVQMIEDMFDKAGFSAEEKIIINYLSNIISDMSKKQLRQFLIWLTGSPCMPQKINITFNTSGGRSKLPVAHSTSHVLELSRDYSSYQDFERVLMDVLSNEFLIVTAGESGR